MIGFLRIQFVLGRVTAEQLHDLIGVLITEEQYYEIIGVPN